MREIKFRGKAKASTMEHNNGWIYGYYVGGFIVGDVVESTNEYIALEFWWPVKRETVGQYTGLKDRNGVEIYEGDIIQTYFSFSPGDAGYGVSQKPFVVGWEQGRTAFRARKPDPVDCHLLDVVDFFEMQSELYEVIGNIHDNPDLLHTAEVDYS